MTGTIKSFVYVIEAEFGVVKIGWSECPETRLSTIATASPCAVRLVAVWPGSRADEAALHQRFQPFRRYNEWFEATGEMAHFIASVRGRGVEAIPDWPSLHFASRRARKQAGGRRASAKLKALWASEEFRARLAMWKKRRAELASRQEAA